MPQWNLFLHCLKKCTSIVTHNQEFYNIPPKPRALQSISICTKFSQNLQCTADVHLNKKENFHCVTQLNMKMKIQWYINGKRLC